MGDDRWTPERTGGLVLLFLVGVLALILGLRLPNPSVWIIGVGAMAFAAMFLLRQFGVGRSVPLVASVVILVAGVGWPLVSAQRNPALEAASARWTSGEASGPNLQVSGDRAYAHSVRGTTVLDRGTGEELWTFQEEGAVSQLEASWLRVSDNGSVLFMYVDDTIVYISPTGRELWRVAGDDARETRVMPYAIAEETVAIGDCVPPAPEASAAPCQFTGMQPDGGIGWERAGYPLPWGGMQGTLSGFYNGISFLDNVPPYLLLRESPDADADILVIDAATGDELERLPAADLVFPVGDLILASERDGDICTLRAARPGREVWMVPEMPCIADPYVTGNRLYAATPDEDSVVTVDLEDGAWRDVGKVDLSTDRIAEWRPTYGQLSVPMEQVIAYVDGDEIRVVDAASGEELWREVPPTGRSRQPWSISVGNDTIAVAYRTDPGVNPFLTADIRDRGLMIIGYNGLTGEPLGQVPSIIESMRWTETPGMDIVPLSWMISAESLIVPAAPGEIYIMRTDDTIVRFGRP